MMQRLNLSRLLGKKQEENNMKDLILKNQYVKTQIIKMIERFFPGLKSLNHDSADALAVAICHSMQKKSKINLFV